MLTDKQIKKFQNIYKKKFGRKISFADAYDKGNNLVCLIELVYKSKTNKGNENEKRKEKSII